MFRQYRFYIHFDVKIVGKRITKRFGFPSMMVVISRLFSLHRKPVIERLCFTNRDLRTRKIDRIQFHN